MRRFELYWCEFEDRKDYSIKGIHPCIIVTSNAIKTSSVITVLPITSTVKNTKQISHVVIENFEQCGLTNKSMILCEQIITISKDKILGKIGYLHDKNTKEKINKSLLIALGIIQ